MVYVVDSSVGSVHGMLYNVHFMAVHGHPILYIETLTEFDEETVQIK